MNVRGAPSTASWIVPKWPAPANVRACATTRPGGVSAGPYATLNLGAHVGDDPARVAANRRAVTSALGLPGEPAWLEQVHGTRIVDLDGGPCSGPADGAVASRPGAVCVVMTADCLPVLLTDRAGLRVGAAHAGWRGLAAGVVGAAVEAMDAAPGDLLAWLGPAIGPAAYEVGPEVRAAFVEGDAAAHGAFAPNINGRWQADLYTLARLALAEAGVTAVYGGGECTYSDPERFFSHRRTAPCGRMATLIWLL